MSDLVKFYENSFLGQKTEIFRSALLSGYFCGSGHLNNSCINLEKNMFALQMYDIKGDKAVTTDDVKT